MQSLNNHLVNKISQLLELARNRVVVTVNQTMVLTYFEIGRMIVEEEQNGENRAEYGKELLKNISVELTKKFGKGFSPSNLQQMTQFYIAYSQTVFAKSQKQISQTASVYSKKTASNFKQTLSVIFQDIDNQENTISETPSRKSEKGQKPSDESEKAISSTLLTKSSNLQKKQTPSAELQQQNLANYFKLSWSHYLKLMRISDVNERNFYEIESFNNNWSVRELQRQYDSALYTRLSLSKNKEEIEKLSKHGQIIEQPKDIIKDPYILEFLGLPAQNSYSENELEQSLIDKLEHFLLELGKGFTFVSRQERISFDEKHFHIDLVFYNRFLKSFVLIDLKIGELKHQDIGQMQMYVNYFDRERLLPDENKTIGIILCQDKSNALVEYTLPEENSQIFASKYMTVLPTKEEFKQILESV